MSKGVEKIKSIVEAVAEFGNIIGDVMVDGKINMADISVFSKLITVGPKFFAAVTNFTEIKEEFKDLTKEELDELKEHFKTKFDIPQDKVEDVVEKVAAALDVVWEAFQVVSKVASMFWKK